MSKRCTSCERILPSQHVLEQWDVDTVRMGSTWSGEWRRGCTVETYTRRYWLDYSSQKLAVVPRVSSTTG